MKRAFKNLTKKELAVFKSLNSPGKIQNFLNKLPQNFEKKGETCMSPRRMLAEKKAHCLEGALFAAGVMWFHDKKPLVVHIKTKDHDQDHVVALFKEAGRFGALSKTNHAVLRYRDPVYKTPRELAMSYFHEYFLSKTGEKTMLGYTEPIDLSMFGSGWLTEEKDLWKINDALFRAPHKTIAQKPVMKKLRRADPVEIKYGDITEW